MTSSSFPKENLIKLWKRVFHVDALKLRCGMGDCNLKLTNSIHKYVAWQKNPDCYLELLFPLNHTYEQAKWKSINDNCKWLIVEMQS